MNNIELKESQDFPNWQKYLDEYISIHCHTSDFKDGAQTIDELINYGKENNKKALALTNHGGVSGLLDFYYKCKENNIKPLLGCEFYYAIDKNDKYTIIKDASGKEKKKPIKPYHLVLIAKNLEGYFSLIRLNNEAQKNFYGKPRIDADILKREIELYGNNIICSTACMKSPIYEHPEHVYSLANIFKDDLYLELQFHGWDANREIEYINNLLKIHLEDGINLSITNDVHIAKEEDLIIHRLLVAIDRNLHINDPRAAYMQGEGYHNISGEELWEIINRNEAMPKEVFYKGIKSINDIVNKCNVELPYKKGQFVFPDFDTPKGYENNYEYLKDVCLKSERYKEDIHKERLELELKVYKDCGFVDYILPLQDVIEFCNKKSIEVGPGRGSAAGSLINYLTHITQLDPIIYGLSFERFITAKFNPSTGLYENARQSAPDVDIDFENNQLVFEYVKNKYGKDKVCGIGTQSLFGPKSAFRATLKAYGLESSLINHYGKFVSKDLSSLRELIIDCPKELEEVAHYLPLALRLEGRVATSSSHAAGVVFSNQLQKHIPLMIDKKNISTGAAKDYIKNDNDQAAVDGDNEIIEDEDSVKYVSQYDMDSIKYTGFTKYDFLGLATLKVLKFCQQKTGISWKDLNPRDPKYKELYECIFKEGRTAGIFQFSSHGMINLLQIMKADRFEDIQACNALFRPQTLKQKLDKTYANNKFSGYESYLNADNTPNQILKDILDETHGVTVYQEQVLDILTKLGSIDFFDADTFRKILSDNKLNTDPEQLAKLNNYKEKFIEGAINNGLNREVAEFLYEELASKSGYSFNKSHSCCYAFIAFALAFYKFYYPFIFIVGVINETPEDLLGLLNDLKGTKTGSNSIRIKYPNLNLSGLHPTVQEDEFGEFIQLGLTNIFGLGESVCKAIIENRPYDFSTMQDVYNFLNDKSILKKYEDDLKLFKANNTDLNLKPRELTKLYKEKYGDKPIVDRDSALGDLSKCNGTILNSKSIEMLYEAGAFSYINEKYKPNILTQLKHFNYIIDYPEELKGVFEKWNTIETIYGSNECAISGYIFDIEQKMTVNKKPFLNIKLFNPEYKTAYTVKVWESSFNNKKNKFNNKIEYGFKERGFIKGDAITCKVKKGQDASFISYISGHFSKDLIGK